MILLGLPRLAAAETPDFRRHIAPLVTKLGCNAAACHGAAEGQAGFHLSLFGYDLEADHRAMVSGEPAPRANWREPGHSLLLRKPAGQEEHGGGELIRPDDDYYKLLERWIEARAPGVPPGKDWLEVTRLTVDPPQIGASSDPEGATLRVVAEWNDGRRELVTRLCRFETKDPSIATVDVDGLVQIVGPGATHVVVYYDDAIQPVEVTAPFETAGESPPPTAATGLVDRAVNRQLWRLRLSPVPVADDATYLRRVTLDVVGRLPSPEEQRRFLSSDDPDRRAAWARRLLASQEYADYWAAWLCELLGLHESVMPDSAYAEREAELTFGWVRSRIEADASWDHTARELAGSLGRAPEQTLVEYSSEMNTYLRPGGEAGFEKLGRLPFFWGRTNLRTPANRALSFGHALLGVKLQCAECHKHPFDRWTKADFEGLAAFFGGIQYGTPPPDRQEFSSLLEAITPEGRLNAVTGLQALQAEGLVPMEEVYHQTNANRGDAPPLALLAAWLEEGDRPLVALAMTNRIWTHYFGVGIIDTPDDLSAGNPPANKELLDSLTRGFIESGYRLRWLHEEIITSDAYQRRSEGELLERARRKHFAQARLRRLPAEVLYDAIDTCTAGGAGDPPYQGSRMVGLPTLLGRSNKQSGLMQRWGQPDGRAVCQRDRSNAPHLRQTLDLYNGPEIARLIDRPGGWVQQWSEKLETSEPAGIGESLRRAVADAYSRALCREPSPDELSIGASYLAATNHPPRALRDLLWSLLNSSEFALNH